MWRRVHTALGVLAALALVAFAAGSASSRPAPAMIGVPTIVVTETNDTLLDIARSYDVGFVEMREANPDIDPWLPGAGKPVRVPTQHILPVTMHSGIVINLAELRLYYFSGGDVHSFPIGTGDEGSRTTGPAGRSSCACQRGEGGGGCESRQRQG